MEGESSNEQEQNDIQRIERPISGLRVIRATAEELAEHESRLDLVEKKGGHCLWRPASNDDAV
jgi:DNA polymerase-3 subunit epsilon